MRLPRYQVLVREDGNWYVVDTEKQTDKGVPSAVGQFDCLLRAANACRVLNGKLQVVIHADFDGLRQNMISGFLGVEFNQRECFGVSHLLRH